MPSTPGFVGREPGSCSVAVLLATAVGMVALTYGAHAYAQCTMDTECKGARICEDGSCVEPPPAALTEAGL
jgi:hypothetical protein